MFVFGERMCKFTGEGACPEALFRGILGPDERLGPHDR